MSGSMQTKKCKSGILGTIAKKSAVILLIVMSVFLLAAGIFIKSYTEKAFIKNIEDSMNAKSLGVANQVNAFFSEKGVLVREITTNQAIVNYLKTAGSREEAVSNPYYADAIKSLEAIKRTDKDVAMVWVSSEKGNFLAGTGNVLSKPDFNLHERPWYKPVIAADGVYYTDPYMDQVFGKVILSVMIQIKDGQNVLGIVAIDLFLDALPEIMKSYKIGESGYTILLAPDGTIIYHPNEQYVVKEKLTAMPGLLGIIGKKMVAGETGLQTAVIDNEEQYICYAPVPNAKWSIATVTAKKEIFKQVNEFFSEITIYFVIAILVLVGLMYFVLQYMLKKLPYLSTMINTIGTGDLTPRLSIESNDELGTIAREMNKMLDSICHIIGKVHTEAEKLAVSSEELSISVSQSAQAANQVATSITQVAGGTENQVIVVDNTAHVVEHMSDGIRYVANCTDQVAESSAQAAEKAKAGALSIEKAVSQMLMVEQTVNSSAGVVTKLGERSKEIGQIVDTISGIASQTNLLALNAAIEAARAGEQGRGFAVVAEEVRKLAEQSQDAAKRIAELISEIQGETNDAVVAMDRGTQEVKVGTEVVNTAGSAFGDIAEIVTHVSGQVTEITAAIHRVVSDSQQIVTAVREINDLSKEAAGEAQTISAAIEEQSASMQQMEIASKGLAEIAQSLKEVISSFKV